MRYCMEASAFVSMSGFTKEIVCLCPNWCRIFAKCVRVHAHVYHYMAHVVIEYIYYGSCL